MSADEAVIVQLEDEEKKWLQQMKEADKRTKASEVAMRDAEPRVLKAEERFRKASIESAAIAPGGKPAEGETKLLREKTQKAEERIRKAEDQAVELEGKVNSLLAQLSELRDKLTTSEHRVKDAELGIEKKKDLIANMTSIEAKMESELRELAVKLEVAKQTHPSFKVSHDIQTFISALLAARKACSDDRDSAVLLEERAVVTERAADVAAKQGYEIGEIALGRGQAEVRARQEQMEKASKEEIQVLKDDIDRKQKEAADAIKKEADEKARKELEEKLRKEAEEKMRRQAEAAKLREAEARVKDAEQAARDQVEQAKKKEEEERERRAKEHEDEVKHKAESEERAKADAEKAKIEAEKAKEEKAKSSVRKRGGPLQVGLLTYVDIDKVKEELAMALRPEVTFSWVVVGYTGPTNISFLHSGSKSVEELLEQLKDDQVQYALLRLPTPSSATKVRDILIKWYGPGVKLMEKGKKQAHIGDIKRILQPFHQELNAIGRKDFNEKKIIERTEVGASHEIE